MEAAEILGMSERTFRRWRDRHDEEGLAGLFDRRLGKASAKRVPVDRIDWMLELYRTVYRGWTVKHFHDRLKADHGFGWGYTWTKSQLQTAGLVKMSQLREIAEKKMIDLNANDIDAACRMLAGTARSMGIQVTE
jgi:transposase